MWINDDGKVAADSGQVLDHAKWIWEMMRIPCEILFVVGVFNVQPHNVHGNVIFVEFLINTVHIVLVFVVPAALVIGQRELLHTRNKEEIQILKRLLHGNKIKSMRVMNHTCGNGADPVKSVYCLNASFGPGPNIMNASTTPPSDMK